MAEPLYCPFCNSALDGDVRTDPPRCPRCEAPLPPEIAATLRDRPASESVPAPAVPNKSATVFAVLGIMLTVAAVAAVFIWTTTGVRREHDYRKGFTPAPATAAKPAELSVLGFLPARCNVIAGLHLADLRENPLARTTLLDAAGPLTPLLESVERIIGLKLADLDQIVMGAELTDRPPIVFAIVRTTRPVDPSQLFTHVKAGRSESLRNRPYARFTPWPIGDAVVWCLEDRLLAVMVRALPSPSLEDLESIPRQPRKDLEGTGELLRSTIRERLPSQSLAWIAGDLGQASGLADFLSVANLGGARVEWLRDLRAGCAALIADREFTLSGQVLANSAAGRKKLERRLTELDWHSLAPPKIVSGEDTWLLFQARYDAAGIRRWLNIGDRLKE